MQRRWKSMTAGILTLIGGIFGIAVGGIVVAGGAWAVIPMMEEIGAGLIALGVVALIGGIFALKRRIWGLSLAGAICALFPLVPLGVLAIIFISLGRREFD